MAVLLSLKTTSEIQFQEICKKLTLLFPEPARLGEANSEDWSEDNNEAEDLEHRLWVEAGGH